jgi:hypothetical protein
VATAWLLRVAGAALLALVPAALVGQAWSVGAAAQVSAELECQQERSPWRSCRMLVDHTGMAWELQLDHDAVHFRHGGDGAVMMRRGHAPWRPVTSHWRSDASLCWNGLCARGQIPLD